MSVQERVKYLMQHKELAWKKHHRGPLSYVFSHFKGYSNCAGTALYALGLYDGDHPLFVRTHDVTNKMYTYFQQDPQGPLCAFRDVGKFFYYHFAVDLGDGNLFHQENTGREFSVLSLDECIASVKDWFPDGLVIDRFSPKENLKFDTFLSTVRL